MRKNSHFSGQPLYYQVIKLLDKSKVLAYSRDNGGERYTKRFNSWIHLVVMLYAVIMRFDSLREITASLLAETRKLDRKSGSARIWVSHLRLDAVHLPTPTKDVRKPYLRQYTVIYMPLTDMFFLRTAGTARLQNG